MYNFGSVVVLEAMFLALRTVWLVLVLGLGLKAQVRAIGFDLGVSVISAAVLLTLDRSTPEHHLKR